MNNFLTTLYFELFRITERERQLMSNNTWPVGEHKTHDDIRNDQSISEVRQTGDLLRKLISQYLEEIK